MKSEPVLRSIRSSISCSDCRLLASSIAAAHFLQKLYLLRRSKGKHSNAPANLTDPWVKNETLSRLGIILLEPEFEDSMERIIQRDRLTGIPEQNQSSLAHQLLLPKQHADDEMGTDYGRVVRKVSGL